MIYFFDCEVFAHDWLFVFKSAETGIYTIIHNDPETLQEFMRDDDVLLCGFNNKHYDQFILKAALAEASPEDIKELNDYIIGGGGGWEHPLMRKNRYFFKQFDVFDDCQVGLSLKAIEAHLGMDIQESEVDFNLDRALTDYEIDETVMYCVHDVDATEELYKLRKNYLKNKLFLGRAKGIPDEKALYMTNAKLTAAYLDAHPQTHTDEREYNFPDNILWEYVPAEAVKFFERISDKSIPEEELFSSKLNLMIGDCQCTLGFGGIHGAIPTYREREEGTRRIRNQDVGSYYPHLMTIEGYTSRAIPNSKIYEEMLERRMAAKKSGDKATANALKLVANTTYGAMLNQYNDLYDPLMGRSVCITGQLRLLELANHLYTDCSTLRIIQLNTDGIMVSLNCSEMNKYTEICKEWQSRTGFELEEDVIKEIIQKDVNNYIEIACDGNLKVKGGLLVRGIAPAGAFNINNNMTIIAKALVDYFAKDVPVEETINNCTDPLAFQIVAKASGKYSRVFQIINPLNNPQEVQAQRCNRVYASKDSRLGTLMKTHKETGRNAKIGGLPTHCLIDNNNEASIEDIDKNWYIQIARKYVNDFLGIKPRKRDTRKVNSLKKEILNILEESNHAS